MQVNPLPSQPGSSRLPTRSRSSSNNSQERDPKRLRTEPPVPVHVQGAQTPFDDLLQEGADAWKTDKSKEKPLHYQRSFNSTSLYKEEVPGKPGEFTTISLTNLAITRHPNEVNQRAQPNITTYSILTALYQSDPHFPELYVSDMSIKEQELRLPDGVRPRRPSLSVTLPTKALSKTTWEASAGLQEDKFDEIEGMSKSSLQLYMDLARLENPIKIEAKDPMDGITKLCNLIKAMVDIDIRSDMENSSKARRLLLFNTELFNMPTVSLKQMAQELKSFENPLPDYPERSMQSEVGKHYARRKITEFLSNFPEDVKDVLELDLKPGEKNPFLDSLAFLLMQGKSYPLNTGKALREALVWGWNDMVRLCLDVGAVGNQTHLHLACEYCNLETVKYLIEKYIAPDSYCLKAALSGGKIKTLQFLIKDHKVLPNSSLLKSAVEKKEWDLCHHWMEKHPIKLDYDFLTAIAESGDKNEIEKLDLISLVKKITRESEYFEINDTLPFLEALATGVIEI